MSRARELARQCEQQILKALSHSPHVGVVVQVDLDALTAAIARSESIRTRADVSPVANRPAALDDPENHLTGFRGTTQGPVESTRESYEQTLLTALPQAARVSVSIPRDYLREVASRPHPKGGKMSNRRDPSEIEDEVIAKVERIVRRLISVDASGNAISVSCVDRMSDPSTDPPSLPVFGRPIDLLTIGIGTIGLALLVLLGLGMLRRSPPIAANLISSPAIEEFEQSHSSVPHASASIGLEVLTPDRTALLRDEIRALVQSEPAASVELLGRWLSEADQ